MKGIILAGGAGTRLHPLTQMTSKQLLPVYDKPMIYYPLSVLMLANIKDILIITTAQDKQQFETLLGDGKQFGIHLEYQIQDKPKGIAEAFILGESFIGDEPVCLILGDNIFYGDGLPALVQKHAQPEGGVVFGYYVKDPSRYGVVSFKDEQVLSIHEKPAKPPSNWAVTGLYCYDASVVELAKTLTPSARGELEITDLNNQYLERGHLTLERLGRGMAWLDTGTHKSLLEASQFVATIEERQGLKIACLEEIAYHQRFINEAQFQALAEDFGPSEYGEYLRMCAKGISA